MKKQPLVAVVGPTASGKTALGIKIAKEYFGEIVSADSMQIYRGMDLLTAKPTLAEQQETPHHMMSFLDLNEEYSVAAYTKAAHQEVAEIAQRGKLPIIVGGTGLYVDALLQNMTFSPQQGNIALRQALWQQLEREGKQTMWERLHHVDPDYANTLHPNNQKRVLRALELFQETGLTMTQQRRNSRTQPSPYQACMIGLCYQERALLYRRIDVRVDQMVKNGMIEEAREIYQSGRAGLTAQQAIGFKELCGYFRNEMSLEDAIATVKQRSRQYAKRQLTWFRKNADIHWIALDESDQFEKIFEECQKKIEKNLYV